MRVRAGPSESTGEWERRVAFQGLPISCFFCVSCTCVCEEMVSCGQARRAFKLKAGVGGYTFSTPHYLQEEEEKSKPQATCRTSEKKKQKGQNWKARSTEVDAFRLCRVTNRTSGGWGGFWCWDSGGMGIGAAISTQTAAF